MPVSANRDRDNPVSPSYGIETISYGKDIARSARAGILPSHRALAVQSYFAQ